MGELIFWSEMAHSWLILWQAMSVDEFVSLPPGEVDPDQVEAEKKYAEE